MSCHLRYRQARLTVIQTTYSTMESNESADRILRSFQAATSEIQQTFKDNCAVMRAEMFHNQRESIQTISDKIKTSTSMKWKREGNKKQFDFNSEVLEIMVRASDACKMRDLTAVSGYIDTVTHKMSCRQKLIRMADSSEGGWQTVREYEVNDLASDSEDEKRINRADARAVKKIKRMKTNKGSSRFRPYGGSFTGSHYATPNIASTSKYQSANRQSTRSGACFSCGSSGHWRRECPLGQQKYNYAPSTSTSVTSARDA